MSKHRIVHVIPTLDQSGAEKQLALLATNLPSDRYEVVVCTLDRGGYYEQLLRSKGIEVHVLGKRLKWDPMAHWKLVGLLRRLKPDLVQTWLFAGNCYGRVAARRAGVGHLICSERCVDRWKKKYELGIDRLLCRWTDLVVVNSHAVGAFYEKKAGVPSSKLRVIPNAVGPDSPAPTTSRDSKLIELGLDPARLTIGFLGRLWPQKNLRHLIWAVDILRINGWKLHLLIIGDGPRRTALECSVRNLELESVVRFLGHRSDAQDLLSALDIVVLPSKFEGMPNAVLEAMQAGKPVVSTAISGMDEVVLDGQTGLLVQPDQPLALARGIHKLLVDPELRQRLGHAGQVRVREFFGIERMVSSYVELYEEMLGK